MQPMRRGMVSIGLVIAAIAIIIGVLIIVIVVAPSMDWNTNNSNTPTPTPETGTPAPTPNDNNTETGTGTGSTTPQTAMTADNRECLTGPELVDRVLLDWDITHFSETTCDKDGNGYFCDAAQFSLSLAYRLEKIRKLAKTGDTEGAEELLEFESFLIPDNYSTDFQKDFAYHYSTQFFNSPEWFSDWNQYFSDPEKLMFFPRNLSKNKPAYYKVTISLVPEENDYSFFNNNETTSIISVSFNRQQDFNEPHTFFYEIPFDGMVGSVREDEDGATERKYYGTGFKPSVDKLLLQKSENFSVDSSVSGGMKEFSVAKPHEFEYTNTRSGMIGYVSREDKVIVFSPTNAWVAVAHIKFSGGKANMFYRIYEDNLEIGEGKKNLSYWRSVDKAKTPNSGYLTEFTNPKYDSVSDDVETCVQVKIDGGTAFGLHLDSFSPMSWIFLKTYFFTPTDKAISLQNACNDNKTSFSTYNNQSDSPSQQIPFDNSPNQINHFFELASLIRDEKVCFMEDNEKNMFFWNVNNFEEQENEALRAAGVKVPEETRDLGREVKLFVEKKIEIEGRDDFEGQTLTLEPVEFFYCRGRKQTP